MCVCVCFQCMQTAVKQCRCGKKTKSLPCTTEYLCETKCTRLKQCGIHQCKRKVPLEYKRRKKKKVIQVFFPHTVLCLLWPSLSLPPPPPCSLLPSSSSPTLHCSAVMVRAHLASRCVERHSVARSTSVQPRVIQVSGAAIQHCPLTHTLTPLPFRPLLPVRSHRQCFLSLWTVCCHGSVW